MTDRELVNLRVSVARIAQAAGLQDMIPGVSDANGALPFEELNRLATEQERGWNFLCAMIVTAIHHGLDTGANLSLRGLAEPDELPQAMADMLREARKSNTGLSPQQVDALSRRFFGVTFVAKGSAE